MSAWQPIETAPKDGTGIDLFCRGLGRVADCVWGEAVCGCHPGNQVWLTIGRRKGILNSTPTHWMPLPEAPKVKP